MSEKMPPLLSVEARRYLVWLAEREADGDGTGSVGPEDVVTVAELVKAGQVALSDYKGYIRVERVKASGREPR